MTKAGGVCIRTSGRGRGAGLRHDRVAAFAVCRRASRDCARLTTSGRTIVPTGVCERSTSDHGRSTTLSHDRVAPRATHRRTRERACLTASGRTIVPTGVCERSTSSRSRGTVLSFQFRRFINCCSAPICIYTGSSSSLTACANA